MPADVFSTRGGYAGFEVVYADGSTFRESEGTWDDVPRDKPIVALRIVHMPTGHAWVEVKDMAEYFLFNEAIVDRKSQVTYHDAKVLGGVKRTGDVLEARVSFLVDGQPTASQRTYPRDQFEHREDILRPGAWPRSS